MPVAVLIDEHGFVRDTRPSTNSVDDFLSKKYPSPNRETTTLDSVVPNLAKLLAAVKSTPTAESWRALGDAYILWGGSSNVDAAGAAYRESLCLDERNGVTNFRLGVAYRMRYEKGLASKADLDAKPAVEEVSNDFALAVEHWGRALELDPNHYIYRRRIQQYGPRLTKPYPFYDWIEQAKTEIRARDEKPVQLSVEPTGAEIAQPSREFSTVETAAKSPDPEGRITRDLSSMIEVESVVVPFSLQPGGAGRVHVSFQPRTNVHWNNEAEPLRIWLEAPKGWNLQQRLLHADGSKSAESDERRSIEFEVQSPSNANSSVTLKGYALYYICEDAGGQCLYRRQDFEIEVKVPR
ncbi:MAG: tetratricopeptide (TPR) repeat protein [Pirellulaceae bacterium]